VSGVRTPPRALFLSCFSGGAIASVVAFKSSPFYPPPCFRGLYSLKGGGVEEGVIGGKGDRPTGDHKGRPYAWKYKDKIPTIWEQVIHNFLLFGKTHYLKEEISD